jgi:hypothetical protein
MTQRASNDLDGSPDGFGCEWMSMLKYCPSMRSSFAGRRHLLEPQDWQGNDVLDTRCGRGRNSYWPLGYGAAY